MLTDEELAGLPEDQDLAFVAFEEMMREKTRRAIFEIEAGQGSARFAFGNTQDEIRHQYICDVIGAAKVFGISPLNTHDIPMIGENHIVDIYNQFLGDVNHAIVQLRLLSAKRNKKYSVALDANAKRKVHHYIQKIREIIENCNLEESKKNKLFEKLNVFDAEVDKTRTSWQAAADIFVALCARFSDGINHLEPARKWVETIFECLGHKKEEEDQQSLLTTNNRQKLSPPRKQIPPPIKDDNEVPF
jgi:hypothetical protein